MFLWPCYLGDVKGEGGRTDGRAVWGEWGGGKARKNEGPLQHMASCHGNAEAATVALLAGLLLGRNPTHRIPIGCGRKARWVNLQWAKIHWPRGGEGNGSELAPPWPRRKAKHRKISRGSPMMDRRQGI